MKKITSLLMMFMLFVGMGWAAETPLPELSENGVIKMYTIKNVRANKFATFNGVNGQMTLQAEASTNAYFYFTGEKNAEGTVLTVKIHNVGAGDLLCQSYNAWTAEGSSWTIKKSSNTEKPGNSISKNNQVNDSWNDAGGSGTSIGFWGAGDPGSTWSFHALSKADVDKYKQSVLNKLVDFPLVYGDVAAIRESIKGVATNDANADFKKVNELYDGVLADAETKTLTFKNVGEDNDNRTNRFLGVNLNDGIIVGVSRNNNTALLEDQWMISHNSDGSFKLFNLVHGKYLGTLGNPSRLSDQAHAANFNFKVTDKANNKIILLKAGTTDRAAHLSNQSFKVTEDGQQWATSTWVVDEAAGGVNTWKEGVMSQLDILNNLSIYGDLTAQKNEIASLLTVNAQSSAVIKVSSLLKGIYAIVDNQGVTFQNMHPSAPRNGLYLGVDFAKVALYNGYNRIRVRGIEGEGDDRVWFIKYNSNGTFKLYNFVANQYLAAPSSSTFMVSNANEAGNYSFEKFADANNPAGSAILSIGKLAQVAHLSNQGGENYRVINHTSKDDASYWKVTLKGDVQADRQIYDKANSLFEVQKKVGLVKEGAKFSSNAQQKNPAEGSFDALIDGNPSTYFHSAWGGEEANIAEPHSITVELASAVSDFYFYMKERDNYVNRPVQITVLGSNEKAGAYETIKEMTTTLQSARDFISEKISSTTPYKFIRFVVKTTNTNATSGSHSQKFFTLSELYLFPATKVMEFYLADKKDFDKVSIMDPTYNDKAQTLLNNLSALNVDNELVKLASMHAVTPALNQYPTDSYNELVESVNSSNSLANIQAAFEKFYKTLNAPVYMLCAGTANSNVYCYNNAAYWTGSAWQWNTEDLFNTSMWFKANGKTSKDVEYGTDYNFVNWNSNTNLFYDGVIVPNQVQGWDGAVTLFAKTYANAQKYLHMYHQGHSIIGWNPASVKDGVRDCEASAWILKYIGNSYDLSKPEVLSALAERQELNALYTANQHLVNLNFGNDYGCYTGGQDFTAAAQAANELLAKNTINDVVAAGAGNIQQLKANLQSAVDGVALVTPKDGAFLRIKASKDNRGEAYPYLVSENSTIKANRAEFLSGAGADVKSIFCFNDGKLVAYNNGFQVLNEDGFASFNGVAEGAPFAFQTAKNNETGAYNIVFSSNRYLFAAQGGTAPDLHYYSDAGGDPNNNGYNFFLEAVNELPVTFKGNETSGYYATINAPVALTIPDGVTAYTGKKGAGVVDLTAVNGVIPANSPVLLKATAPGVKNFTIAYDNNDVKLTDNDFVGTIATVAKGEGKFLGLGFGAQDKTVVGFYNVNAANLKGFRARLTNDGAQVNSLRLNFGEATGIEGVVEELNGKAEIFDLSGRRVVAPKKGLYIVNGKKVYVK